MKKLISSAIFISLLLAVLSPAVSAAAAGPEIRSAAAIVLNAEDGEVFYAKDETRRVQPADTAMLMTALLAVEAVEEGVASLYAEITVSESAFADLAENTTRYLLPGETLALEDLLYLMLLPSAADACNAVAEFLGGSVSDFTVMMDARAAELGCADTHFANAHGLYDARTRTTTADMARIALEACQHETLMNICGARSAVIPATNLSEPRPVLNMNALLCGETVYGSGYLYDRASGLKNGMNGTAGYTLLASAEDPDSGVRLIAAVFGGAWDEVGCTNFADAAALLDWAFGSYSYQQVLDPNVSVASVDVSLGKDVDYVNLRPSGAVTLLLPVDYDQNEIQYDYHVYSIDQGKTVTAPVTAGEVLGEVSVLRHGQVCGTAKLVAATSVDLSRGQYILTHLRETSKTAGFFWLCFAVVVILGAYIAWVVLYRLRRRRYVGAVRSAAALREAAKPAPQPAAREPEIEYFNGAPEPPQQAALEDTTPIPDLAERWLDEVDPPLPEAPGEAEAAPPEGPDAAFPNETGSAPPEDPSIYRSAGRDYFEEFFRKK